MADAERAEVLAFEAATFPEWVVWFERLDASVLVARDRAGGVMGTLLFSGPPGATIYEPMLGRDAGTIGCVGVAAAVRGAGVGSAMVARASELLRDAGTRACHIGWTPAGAVLRPPRLHPGGAPRGRQDRRPGCGCGGGVGGGGLRSLRPPAGGR